MLQIRYLRHFYWTEKTFDENFKDIYVFQCMEYDEYSSESPRNSTPGPPPPYELVVPSSKIEEQPAPLPETAEPPSYEKACKLSQDTHISAQGYV